MGFKSKNDCDIPQRLNAVLYFLYQISNVNDDSVYLRLAKYLLKTHTTEEIKQTKDAVDWGLNNPQINFSEMLPGLRKHNEEILRFFKRLSEVLQKVAALSDVSQKQ